ncbi:MULTISPECIES: hypothetical protein [Aestuariibaculum]|uniref:Alginate biosynthesis protein AlgF n=1 Tax=Aestuariibaculum lutulentum TaxID=2920935 RepID=A0ABS9RGG1_9FLAO|nr:MULTISPECIES: hypothetical protein [Aestuariibaculum]MCH4552029.1 hypothetical protein [Aestuariibaculum lutulentum]MCR8667122.1 hypothetical protein [Aestuariibaculum sp. M13]
MKKTINVLKKGILLLAVSTSLLSNASDIIVSTNAAEISKTAITLNHVKAGDILSLKDNYGVVLYTEQIKETGTYKKGFDLSALPNGEYTFEIDKNLEVKTIPFTVNFENVYFNKEKETTSYKPYVRQENGIVYITKLAPKQEALNIHIYANNNSDYELIHSERIKGVQSIEKAYKLGKGDYKIVFVSDNKEYTKFINN